MLNGVLHDGGWWAAHDSYNYSDVKKDKVVSDTTTGGWLGFTDKYWLTALVPPQQMPVTTALRYNGEGHRDVYQADFTDRRSGGRRRMARSPPRSGSSPAPRKCISSTITRRMLGIPRFDRAIDFGLFYWITKPIFLTLDFFSKRIFYGAIGSFGLSILLLTLCIKLLFFPLANKSYRADGQDEGAAARDGEAARALRRGQGARSTRR